MATKKQQARRIEYRPLDDIQANPRNPKAHDVDTINDSVNRFGYIDGVVIDERTGYLISGHGRTKSLRAMRDRGDAPPDGVTVDQAGAWLVPVQVGWASRTDAEAEAALIALNRTTELGGWVDESLLTLLDGLDDHTGIGYTSDDIEDLRTRLNELTDEPVPTHPGGGTGRPPFEAKDLPGVRDLVTLHHGDCIEVMRTLPAASVDAIVTDPPYGLGFMGKEWDDLPPGKEWAEECLRVLKPGGHVLAFGGSRTWHRLAVAVEDAGFEIRDSIAWLYGSGFPKSLDVSKAIDKAAGAEREVVGRADRKASLGSQGVLGASRFAEAPDITAPATPDAERWQGWGTALKPAFEPIVVGRKPLASPRINVLSRVESELRARGLEGEIRWTTGPASDAARLDPSTSSSSTEAQPTAGASADPAAASETPNDERPTGRSSATSTLHGAQRTASTSGPMPAAEPPSSETRSLTPTAAPAPAATSESATSSPSITSTEAEPRTARRPGARSTTKSSAKDSHLGIESFAGIATGLTGSWATVRIDRLADGTCVWPDGLPRNTAGGSTVAGNVLAHGTGALNIDGCRVGTTDELTPAGGARVMTNEVYGKGLGLSSGRSAELGGRWPANVVLDESQAVELDRQSGVLTSGSRGAGTYGLMGYMGADAAPMPAIEGDHGGASRFFPTFRYEAKAPTSERPREDDTAHPTVKPLDLMRWLVRLVTPPGGAVLDPFAGSGTTLEAAVLEGFACIGIEREASYLPLIRQRLGIGGDDQL